MRRRCRPSSDSTDWRRLSSRAYAYGRRRDGPTSASVPTQLVVVRLLCVPCRLPPCPLPVPVVAPRRQAAAGCGSSRPGRRPSRARRGRAGWAHRGSQPQPAGPRGRERAGGARKEGRGGRAGRAAAAVGTSPHDETDGPDPSPSSCALRLYADGAEPAEAEPSRLVKKNENLSLKVSPGRSPVAVRV